MTSLKAELEKNANSGLSLAGTSPHQHSTGSRDELPGLESQLCHMLVVVVV